jgi:hypothetical protein
LPTLAPQLVLYFLFGHNMIAFAFLLSCFFTSSKTATVFAYLIVFGTGLIGSLLLSRLMNGDFWYMNLVELIPSFALYRRAPGPPGRTGGEGQSARSGRRRRANEVVERRSGWRKTLPRRMRFCCRSF